MTKSSEKSTLVFYLLVIKCTVEIPLRVCLKKKTTQIYIFQCALAKNCRGCVDHETLKCNENVSLFANNNELAQLYTSLKDKLP